MVRILRRNRIRTIIYSPMLEKINHKSAPEEVVNALVTLYHEGKYDDVLSRSSQLIKEYPHTFVLHNIVGAISFEKGQKKVAIEHFRKAIELRPHHPHAYNNLGTALIDISEYQEAISHPVSYTHLTLPTKRIV